jgi:hypothetical protein
LEPGQWLELLLGQGGVLVALIIVIITGIRKFWVFGWQYQELKKQAEERYEEIGSRCTAAEQDRDRFLELAFRGTNAAEEAARLAAEKLANKTVGELTDEELRQLMRQRKL